MQSRKDCADAETDARQLVLDWGDGCSGSAVRQAGSMTEQHTHDAQEPVAMAFPGHLPQAQKPAPASPIFAAPTSIAALTELHHPCANRQIVLTSHALGYWLKRSRRRTVGMRVTAQGLEVSAPGWVGQGEIDRILQNKSGWIVGKLEDQARLKQEQQQARPHWLNGQYLP